MYANLAENLLHGRGYLGPSGDPELLYGPLFPFLIAAVALVTRSTELATHIVTLVCGALLALPLYLIAKENYRVPTAIVCVVLVALHPLLIGFSAAAYNETIYLTAFSLCLYWALRCLRPGTPRDFILCGVFLGLAYLCRAEAYLFAGFLAVLLCAYPWGGKSAARGARRGAVLLVFAFALVALPYVVFLTYHTGHFRLDAKTKLNYTIGRRINGGMSSAQAQFGISPALEDEGPLLAQRRFADYSPYPTSTRDVILYFLHAALRNKAALLETLLLTLAYGAPLLPFLAVLGLFRTVWDADRLRREIFLLACFLMYLGILSAAHYIQFRYTLPLVPFLLIWSSHGITEFSGWARGSASFVSAGFRKRAGWIGYAATGALLLLVLVPAAVGVFHVGVDNFEREGNDVRPVKTAGLWLEQNYPGPKRVMDASSVLNYYANGILMILPYADSSLALRYIRSRRPDFIVVSDLSYHSRPYLEDWFIHGIPDPSAKLIYDGGGHGSIEVKIYHWMDRAIPPPGD